MFIITLPLSLTEKNVYTSINSNKRRYQTVQKIKQTFGSQSHPTKKHLETILYFIYRLSQ